MIKSHGATARKVLRSGARPAGEAVGPSSPQSGARAPKGAKATPQNTVARDRGRAPQTPLTDRATRAKAKSSGKALPMLFHPSVGRFCKPAKKWSAGPMSREPSCRRRTNLRPARCGWRCWSTIRRHLLGGLVFVGLIRLGVAFSVPASCSVAASRGARRGLIPAGRAQPALPRAPPSFRPLGARRSLGGPS